MAKQIGRSVPRIEGAAKVSGTAEYIHNLVLPGMLHGKIYRSTVPHGRLTRVDTTAAAAHPGVYAVFTGTDVKRVMPDPYYGPAFHDQPVLALDKVRFVGDPIAVVLASDPHVAEEALDLIEVEYEELPAVYNEVEAAQPGAPIVHDVLKPASMFTDLKHLAGRTGTNVAMDYRLRRGDVEQGFKESDHVFEDTFNTQQTAHLTMEPIVTVAEVSHPGRLVIHTASQGPSFVRAEVARLLGWAENRVRVRTAYLGGGFGAKLYIKLEALVAACTLLTGKPVKISLTMEEQFLQITKHASTYTIKTGVKNDGTIVARSCKIWWNGGAYADIGPRITQKSGFTAAGLYDIENVSIDSYAVYTNRPAAGPLRGFGIPQLVWAYECQADIMAHRLGMDPVAFRRKNLLVNGRPHATGTIMKDTGTEQVLDDLVKAIKWDEPIDKGTGTIRRGRGLGLGVKAVITPTTSGAIVNMYGDGSVGVYCSITDMGQGSDTAFAQITAEVLGLTAEEILVVHPDTDVTPYDMSTLGSRGLFYMGNAIHEAAVEVADQIKATAATRLNSSPADLRLEGGAVVGPAGSIHFAELMVGKFGMQAGNLIGRGSFTPSYQKPDPMTGQSDNVTANWMIGGTAVEIEVDTETGRIRVLKMINAGDVGTPINPDAVEKQLYGASIMQLGFTLTEEMHLEGGQVVNASLADYKIPGLLDLPLTTETLLATTYQHNGPYGAKGAGESGTFGVSPAIANALYDATGIWVKDLPITAEKVLRAIRAAEGRPMEEE